MRRTAMMVALVAALGVAAFGARGAAAERPANPECWGVVTSQRATALHDVGEHSSAQEEPRTGLGNLPDLFGVEHVSDIGTFLAGVDGIDETSCP